MATVDIVPMLAAPAGTDGTLDGQAISGVPSMPTTCSTVCLPRHPVAVPVLVAPPILAPPECVLDTNTLVAAVPLATMGEFPAIRAPTAFTPMIQMQQLYGDSELVRPRSSQCVTNKVPLHRPMPWPSLLDIQPNGDDTRPLPWPSFREDYNCEAPSVTILKPSQWCTSDRFRAESHAALEFQILEFYGNHFTSTGYIFAQDMCFSSELRCLDEMLSCLEYWWSTGNYVQSVDTTLVWHLRFIPGFPLWVIVRSFELRLFSNAYATICVLPISVEGVNIAALSYEPDHYCGSYELEESVVLNVLRSSSNYVLCDEWLLQPWYSGQQDVPYDQFSCEIQGASCWRGYFVAGVHMSKQHGELLPESAMTWASSHDPPFEPIPITFQVFSMNHELGQKVLRILNHYDVVRYLGLCSVATVVMKKIVNIYNGHPSTAVMNELISADATENSWDVPVLSSMCPSIIFGTVQILFSASITDEAIQLYKEHFHDTSLHAGEQWHDLLTSSNRRFTPHKCMHGTNSIKRSTQYLGCPNYSFLWDVHLIMEKSKQQFAVCCNCIAGRQFYLGTNTVWNSYSNYCMMIVSNSSFISMKLLRQSDDVHLQLWPMHKFPLISRAGIFTPVILPVNNHWWNCIKDQWLYFLWCGVLLAELSILIICKIGWPPCALACFIITKGDMPWLLVEMRMPISTTYAGELSGEQWDSVLGCLFKAIKRLHIDHTFNQDQVCTDHDYQLDSFEARSNHDHYQGFQHDLGATKKCPPSWDPGGSHTTGFGRRMMLRLPWDPGVAAAWGQAAFQGGGGVRDPSYTAPWAGTWAIVMGWAYYRGPAAELQIQKEQQ